MLSQLFLFWESLALSGTPHRNELPYFRGPDTPLLLPHRIFCLYVLDLLDDLKTLGIYLNYLQLKDKWKSNSSDFLPSFSFYYDLSHLSHFITYLYFDLIAIYCFITLSVLPKLILRFSPLLLRANRESDSSFLSRSPITLITPINVVYFHYILIVLPRFLKDSPFFDAKLKADFSGSFLLEWKVEEHFPISFFLWWYFNYFI